MSLNIRNFSQVSIVLVRYLSFTLQKTTSRFKIDGHFGK